MSVDPDAVEMSVQAHENPGIGDYFGHINDPDFHELLQETLKWAGRPTAKQILDDFQFLNGFIAQHETFEEKRAAKLGFSNLHDYLEDKFAKKAQAMAEEESKLSAFK